MNLGLCIANLLRRYPAVEVPGIGVFKIVRIPAVYDQEQSVVRPPASHIELSEEDGDSFSVVSYLRAQRNVDEDTALQMLDKAVRQLAGIITREGQALLDGVGYLTAEGASFAFKPFDTRAMEVLPIDVLSESDAEMAAVADVREEEGEAVAPDEQRRSYAGWWVAAALVLLSVAGGMWFYKPDWFGRKMEGDPMAQNRQSEVSENVGEASDQTFFPVDSVTDSVSARGTLQSQAADSVRADTVAAVAQSVKPAITYEIIVGSFATMAQAQKYVAEMKAKGYELQALDSRMPGNRKKISWGSYTTEEEAYQELLRVQKNFEPGAWIAKVEND